MSLNCSGLAVRLALGVLCVPVAAGISCAAAAPVLGYRVVARFPHSTESYTEGFFYLDGFFYEGTGLRGESGVRVTQPETGRILQESSLPSQFFGEGIVNWGPNLLEWTWQSHTGFVLDRHSLRTVGEFHYTGEGWGMTRTATQLITSDGTPVLSFRDPATFRVQRRLTVHDGATPVQELNELEYIHGEIYANVWQSDRIARISPTDGHVIAWIDLAGILPDDQRRNGDAVLNGIAYDPKGDRLFVTGKQWPWVFQIITVPRP